MNEPKFTKGKWKIVYAKGSHALVLGKYLEIGINCKENYGDSTSNAQLISSAPELYEALEEIKLLLDMRKENAESKIYIKLLKALAKARGE